MTQRQKKAKRHQKQLKKGKGLDEGDAERMHVDKDEKVSARSKPPGLE